ncbi:hypothetical protein K457DRAFT_138230 [Linnemannia elongata AG-77]|uniref:Uncharacterized protein n=1 Tax=Linnemannia elongata AG-77 TaxID=1314771 RepID=A0A197JVD5_9FUNG|nr:hypothetical protein K457DRAFT_138230 [Linnemannia elongata AG-77]
MFPILLFFLFAHAEAHFPLLLFVTPRVCLISININKTKTVTSFISSHPPMVVGFFFLSFLLCGGRNAVFGLLDEKEEHIDYSSTPTHPSIHISHIS